MSSYPHLHPGAIEQIHLSAEDRIHWMRRPRWFGYPEAERIHKRLHDLVDHPRQSRMPNMLLIGESNNGKTHLIRRFLQDHPPQENVSGEHIIAPVICIQSPPSPSEASLYIEILHTLYRSVPASSTDAKRTRAIEVMDQVQVKVLVIDELHNLLAGGSVKQQTFLNVLKYLSNRLQISIVGCGTGDLQRAISIDPQIQNRFTPALLPKWQMNDDFRRLLRSFEVTLPLREASRLHDPSLARKILAMAEGTIGEVSTLLIAAASYALNNGEEKITADTLNLCGYLSPSARTLYAAHV